MKNLKLFILTLILSVALLVGQIYVVRVGSQYTPEVEVLYAKEKITANSIITEDKLMVKKIGINLLNKQSVKDKSEIIGKKAKIDIEEGEMILQAKISKGNDMKEIEVLNKENRLFTLELKGDQANGWWLLVDQLVDIIYVPNPKLDGTVGNIEKLSNIRIAALISDQGTLLDNNHRDVLPKWVSLEVTKDQSEFLAYAKGNGRLELAAIPGKDNEKQ